jgi:hypothetical protein
MKTDCAADWSYKVSDKEKPIKNVGKKMQGKTILNVVVILENKSRVQQQRPQE